MYDIVANFLSQEQIRSAVVTMDIITAIIIGPFLAFAVTDGAGFRCYLAFLRSVQRAVLVGFSIVLMYNATYILSTERTPAGSAVLITVFIFLSTVVSGLRHLASPPVPRNMNWRDYFHGHATPAEKFLPNRGGPTTFDRR